jgi:hypothetical protein
LSRRLDCCRDMIRQHCRDKPQCRT